MKKVVAALLVMTFLAASAASQDAEFRYQEASERHDRVVRYRRIAGLISIGGLGASLLAAFIMVPSMGDDGEVVPGREPLYNVGMTIGVTGLLTSIGSAGWMGVQHVRSINTGRRLQEARYAVIAEQRDARIAGYSKREQDAVRTRSVYIGMRERVLRDALGQPLRVNRTVTESGEQKQFVYSGSRFVYVEDGVVTAWQD